MHFFYNKLFPSIVNYRMFGFSVEVNTTSGNFRKVEWMLCIGSALCYLNIILLQLHVNTGLCYSMVVTLGLCYFRVVLL